MLIHAKDISSSRGMYTCCSNRDFRGREAFLALHAQQENLLHFAAVDQNDRNSADCTTFE